MSHKPPSSELSPQWECTAKASKYVNGFWTSGSNSSIIKVWNKSSSSCGPV
nr:hypothetical protein Iba_chr06cCG8230 [Ipomoea batatas]